MEAIYVFLIRNDVWIYILCALGLVWYLGQVVRSRSMLRRSIFGLEIEKGRRMMSRSLLLVFLFAAIAGAVTYVNLQVAPTLPPELLRPPTPTPNIFATPLSSPTPSAGQATPTIALAPTVTLAASSGNLPADNPLPPEQPELEGSPTADEVTEPVAPSSNLPSGVVGACSPGVNISTPPTGAIVSNVVTFFGTASGEDFGFFELEASGPQTGNAWTSLPLQDSDEQVFDNILGRVDLSSWQAGPYNFRLSVFDSLGTTIGQCAIQLAVDAGGPS